MVGAHGTACSPRVYDLYQTSITMPAKGPFASLRPTSMPAPGRTVPSQAQTTRLHAALEKSGASVRWLTQHQWPCGVLILTSPPSHWSSLRMPRPRVQEFSFHATLSALSATDVLKFKAHAEEEARETGRVKKIQSSSNMAAHAAAAEWLASKADAGPQTRSLREVADRYETTVSMVRTAKENQTHPYTKRKPGPRPLLSEDDFDLIAQYCLHRAMDDAAVTKAQLASLMLRLVNQHRVRDGKAALDDLGDKRYNTLRKKLKDHCDRIDLPLIVCRKTPAVDKKRRMAETAAIPTFVRMLERYKEQYPEDFANPANWMNLDEQALCDKPSNGKTQSTMQVPSVTGGIRGAAAEEAPPPPCTLVSITFADGGKGPAIILRKGTTPFIESWFSQLPPGLTQSDIEQSWYGPGNTDRMTYDKLRHVLENVVYPKHVKRAGEGQQLFWVMDAPTWVYLRA